MRTYVYVHRAKNRKEIEGERVSRCVELLLQRERKKERKEGRKIEKRRTSGFSFLLSDLSDVPENLPLPAPGSESPQALNYSQIASAAVAVSQGGQDPSVSSTETLLRNIQGLLKVAADNARQQERQINYEKGQCRISSRGRSSYYPFPLANLH